MFILNNKNSPSLAIRFVLLFGIFTDENQTALLGESEFGFYQNKFETQFDWARRLNDED